MVFRVSKYILQDFNDFAAKALPSSPPCYALPPNLPHIHNPPFAT